MSSAIFRAASASSTSTKKLRDSKTKQLGNQEFCTKSLKNNVSNLRITESQAQSNLSGDLQIKGMEALLCAGVGVGERKRHREDKRTEGSTCVCVCVLVRAWVDVYL